MTVVVMKKRIPTVQEYEVPAGATIMWFGAALEVPSGFAIDSNYDDRFVIGADEGEATNVPAGSNAHSHLNSTSGSVTNHNHVVVGSTGANTDSVDVPGQANTQAVAEDHDHEVSGEQCSLDGAHSHGGNDTLSADGTPSHVKMYFIKATSTAILPVNGIIMWDGLLGSVPDNFSLCDGQNTTPDLRSKFVYGAPDDIDVGEDGGTESHVHQSQDTVGGGAHDHDLSGILDNCGAVNQASGFAGIEAAANHGHSGWGISNVDPDHTHGIPDTGNGSSLPPYLMLYFIMRKV